MADKTQLNIPNGYHFSWSEDSKVLRLAAGPTAYYDIDRDKFFDNFVAKRTRWGDPDWKKNVENAFLERFSLRELINGEQDAT